MTLKPGLYPGIRFPDYQDIDAANCSTLKKLREGRTPAHARNELLHPKPESDAFRIGHACHAAMLEPDVFEKDYAKAPKIDRRTIKGKAAAAEWEAKHGDQIALFPDEYDMALAMRDAVRAHPDARGLITRAGQNELTVVWNDEATGLLCKGRIDRLTTLDAWTVIADLKTAREIGEREWAKAYANFGYHWQAAFYLDGLNALAPRERRFLNIAVEKTPPYCVIVYEPDDSVVEEGRAQYRRALDLYAECQKTGEWPGYEPGIYAFDIPKWGYELTPPPK